MASFCSNGKKGYIYGGIGMEVLNDVIEIDLPSRCFKIII
jgi:hypothetical protein